MIKFFRKIRHKLLFHNKLGKYLIYAFGEIALVVIGILIALQVNNWNEKRRLLQKEINILKAFDLQFENDLMQFDESLALYKVNENSIDILLNHLENNLSHHDSLNEHFFTSTRIYIDADIANNIFETLKSDGMSLISNEDIRSKIVLLYEDEDMWIKNFETMYINFIMNASETLFPSRFRDFWHGDYTDPDFVGGSMAPLNFEALKEDQEYQYFLRTQKNHLGWLIKRPILDTKSYIIALRADLKKEIETLETK